MYNYRIIRTIKWIILISFICLISPISAQEVSAQEITDPPATFTKQREHSKRLIDNILSGNEFQHHESTTGWRIVLANANQQHLLLDHNTINLIVKLVQGFIWLAIFTLFWLLIRYRHRWQQVPQTQTLQLPDNVPTSVFGLDIKRETLPENIANQAQQLWRVNQHYDAVSLLYRGALSVIFYANRFTLTKGATENDCVRLVKTFENDERAQCFSQLTELWLLAAYAKRLPSSADFNKVCQNWIYAFSDVYYTSSKNTDLR